MTTLINTPTLGDLLKYELNGNYSREVVTLKSGTNYAIGSVLGKITASGKYRLSPAAAVTGDEGAETATAILIEAVDAAAADKTGLVSVDQAGEKTAKHVQLAPWTRSTCRLPPPWRGR
jgi:hypothetical protein